MTSQEHLPAMRGGELAPSVTGEPVALTKAALYESGPDGVYRQTGQDEPLTPMRQVVGEAEVVADVTVVGVNDVAPDAAPRSVGTNGLAAVAAERHNEVR